MMKFPSASAVGIASSGSSWAVTYPSRCGSRAGGAGRRGRVVAGAVCGAATVIAASPLAIRMIENNTAASFVFMEAREWSFQTTSSKGAGSFTQNVHDRTARFLLPRHHCQGRTVCLKHREREGYAPAPRRPDG